MPHARGEFIFVACGLAEIAGLEPGRRAPERPFAISTGPGLAQVVRVDVGGQNRDVPFSQRRNQPGEQDGQGIRLFAGTAPGAPQPDSLFPAFAACGDQFGEDVLLKGFQSVRFAVKIGFAHGQCLRQGILFRRGDSRGQETDRVRLGIGKAHLRAAALQPAGKNVVAFRGKVESHASLDQAADGLQCILFHGHRVHADAPDAA